MGLIFVDRYNTDMSAAIGAIEARLGGASSSGASPLAGKTFVLVGAGGAGRALAYGAAAKYVSSLGV